MSNRLNTLLCVILLFSCFVEHSRADIYFWVDENGVKHFSNDDDAKLNDNVNSQDEIEYSEADQKKWERQKRRYRSYQQNKRRFEAAREQEEKERKQKCLEAKEFEKEVTKKYTTFTPEPMAHGLRPREKRDLRKRNEENYKKWETESKKAHERARQNLEKYCN